MVLGIHRVEIDDISDCQALRRSDVDKQRTAETDVLEIDLLHDRVAEVHGVVLRRAGIGDVAGSNKIAPFASGLPSHVTVPEIACRFRPSLALQPANVPKSEKISIARTRPQDSRLRGLIECK